MDAHSVWKTCKFSDEIINNQLDYSKFAVELHSVLDGSAADIYKDPKLFLKNTFLTSNAKLILKDALVRVSRGEGQPAYIIDTEFGGGKTHTILLLYHLFKNKDLGRDYIKKYNLHKDYDIADVPQTNVVAIDCRRLTKNTLWGEIADSLGRYKEMQELDRAKQPIKDIGMIKALFDKPTLLLIDELPHFLLTADAEQVGKVTLADLTIGFILNLISAVSASKNSVLIMTLTAKQQLYERYTEKLRESLKSIRDYRVDTIVDNLRDVLSRQVQFKAPVEKKEVYDVIRTRLVKEFNQNVAAKVTEEYYKYYVEKGIPVDPDFQVNLRKAYPFHPFLIDVLYERVSTVEKFNRTRGILRLLALVLRNLNTNKENCQLVSTADVQLEDKEIQEELTSKIDMADYKPVIESDCIKKSKALDEKRNIKVFERMARTIYIYSIIGSSRKSGIKKSELQLGVCYPGIDPDTIEEALDDMSKQYWYLKQEGTEFYFDKEPSINKIIYDYAQEVSPRETKDKIYETLDSLLPPQDGVNVILWDREMVEDNDKLKIFAVNYEEKINEDNYKEYLKPLIEYRPNGDIRDYQNTLVFIYADRFGVESLVESAKLVCAIEKAQKDERIKLDKNNMPIVRDRLNHAQGNLKSECMNVYSKVAYSHLNDLRSDAISTLDTKSRDLTGAILELLRKKGQLVDKLLPDVLSDMIEDKARVEDVYALFKKDKSKRLILNGKVILEAVQEGVKQGTFGYSEEHEPVQNEGKYVARIGENIAFVNWSGWIIKKDRVYSKSEQVSSKEQQVAENERGSQEQLGGKPEYHYSISCHDLKELFAVLQTLPVIIVGSSVRSQLHVSMRTETDTISIDTNPAGIPEIKSLIQSLMNRYSGNGSVIVTSDTDLTNEFTKYKIKVSKT